MSGIVEDKKIANYYEIHYGRLHFAVGWAKPVINLAVDGELVARFTVDEVQELINGLSALMATARSKETK